MMEMEDEDIDAPLKMIDFETALSNCNKSVSDHHLAKFEKWRDEFGCT